jgi:thioester reductase-like protein
MLKLTPVDNLDLNSEVVLDPKIQFNPPRSNNWATPQSILLTGASGFVGAYLLDELFHQTTADLYCLIRANHPAAGKERLKQHLQSYSLWDEAFHARLIPVIGDLSKPLLGLSAPQFNQLAEQIEVIFHNGAQVNAMYPYSKLKATNVLGTQEILRLASLTHTKPVHFVSTLAVFLSPSYANRIVLESDLPTNVNLKGGYKQSKWVAEQLIMVAQQRGLPASIYRTARIMGHSHTGIINNFKDLLYSLLKSCIQLKKYPLLDSSLSLVPIDYVSQAIVHLSRQPESFGKAFHLFNPKPISWQQLFDQVRYVGYPLAEMEYDNWLEALKHHVSQHPEDKISSSLLLLLRGASSLLLEKPLFEPSHTLTALTNTRIVCPPMDSTQLSVYFSYFQQRGFFPLPPTG